jgi:hypothetical protein
MVWLFQAVIWFIFSAGVFAETVFQADHNLWVGYMVGGLELCGSAFCWYRFIKTLRRNHGT